MAVRNEAPLQAAAPRAQRGQARIHVQVQDINEAPVFQENPLRTSLPEGALPGTPVATFSAQDPDTQQPQRLRWGPRVEAEGAQGPLVHCPARTRSTADLAQRTEGSSVHVPEGPWGFTACVCVRAAVNLSHEAGLRPAHAFLARPSASPVRSGQLVPLRVSVSESGFPPQQGPVYPSPWRSGVEPGCGPQWPWPRASVSLSVNGDRQHWLRAVGGAASEGLMCAYSVCV